MQAVHSREAEAQLLQGDGREQLSPQGGFGMESGTARIEEQLNVIRNIRPDRQGDPHILTWLRRSFRVLPGPAENGEPDQEGEDAFDQLHGLEAEVDERCIGVARHMHRAQQQDQRMHAHIADGIHAPGECADPHRALGETDLHPR